MKKHKCKFKTLIKNKKYQCRFCGKVVNEKGEKYIDHELLKKALEGRK